MPDSPERLLLDSSAILAVALNEPGSDAVRSACKPGKNFVLPAMYLEARRVLTRRSPGKNADQALADTLGDLRARLETLEDPTLSTLAEVDDTTCALDVELKLQNKQAISLGDRLLVAYAVANGLTVVTGDSSLKLIAIADLDVLLMR